MIYICESFVFGPVSSSLTYRDFTLILQGIVTLNIGKLEYKIIGDSGLDNTEARDNPNGFDADMAERDTLDAFMDLDVPNSSIDQLDREIDENILTQPSERIAKIARSAIAELYLYFHKTHNNDSKSVPMHGQSQKIYVEGFDVEQIWLQQDMLVSPSIGRLRKQLRKFKGMEKVVPSDVEDAIDGEILKFLRVLFFFCFKDKFIKIYNSTK